MKNIFLIIFLSSFLLADDLLISTKENFSKLIKEVKTKQMLKPKIKELTYNPFLFNITKQENVFENNNYETIEYHLSAILNNKVLLNEKWYKVNDFIGDIKIFEIKNKSVVLFDSKSNSYLTVGIGSKDGFSKEINNDITDNSDEENLIKELRELNLIENKKDIKENNHLIDNEVEPSKNSKKELIDLRNLKFEELDNTNRIRINLKNKL